MKSDTVQAQRYNGGHRFTGVDIPQGSTIDTADLAVYMIGTFADDANADIYAEDVDDAVDFATNQDVTSRTRTGASVSWVAFAGGVGYKTSPEIKTVIFAVTDRGGWSTGNALVVLVSGKGNLYKLFTARSFAGNSSQAAKLNIDYTAGTGFVEGAVSLSGIGSMAAVASLTLPAAVAMSGVGTMVVAGTKGTTKTGAAVLSGVGTMSGVGVITASGEAAMSGVGSMAVVGRRIVPGAVAMSGVGSMSAIGEVSGLLEGRATVSGVGTMTVVAERIAGGSVSFSGVGSMSVEAAVTLVGQASLSGVGSMAVIGETGVALYTVFGNVLRSIDPNDWPTGTEFFLEVVLAAFFGDLARARLFNITDAAAVENSDLSTAGSTPTRLRSSALSLPSGAKDYRMEYGGISPGVYTVFSADLVVKSD